MDYQPLERALEVAHHLKPRCPYGTFGGWALKELRESISFLDFWGLTGFRLNNTMDTTQNSSAHGYFVLHTKDPIDAEGFRLGGGGCLRRTHTSQILLGSYAVQCAQQQFACPTAVFLAVASTQKHNHRSPMGNGSSSSQMGAD